MLFWLYAFFEVPNEGVTTSNLSSTSFSLAGFRETITQVI